MSYSIDNIGVIYLDNKKLILPRDGNYNTVSLLFAVSDDEKSVVPIKVLEDGSLKISAQLNVGDIQIGAVELKDSNTDIRANIVQEGEALSTNLSSFVLFGVSDNKPQTFRLRETNNTFALEAVSYLCDIQGNLINPATEQTLLNILKKLSIFNLQQTEITRDINNRVSQITITEDNITKKISFNRNTDGYVTSIQEELI